MRAKEIFQLSRFGHLTEHVICCSPVAPTPDGNTISSTNDFLVINKKVVLKILLFLFH
jgi:hypothetical protein